MRAEKPIAIKKQKLAKSKLVIKTALKDEKMTASSKLKLKPNQQFKSSLEVLHKREVKVAAEAKVRSDVRNSMYSKHRLAKTIAKSLGL